MDNQNLIKAALIFGGGFALFALLRPKDPAVAVAGTNAKKSFDDKLYPPPSKADAEIVLIAYTDALKAGEPPARLTELNKECMDEFGMRCYIDTKSGKAVVCDVKGDTILSK
jgi:hypothetical protein